MNLKQARQWCAAAHGNQGYGNTRTDDGGMDGFHPYSFHLNQGEQLLLRFGIRSISIRKAFWGHDVVEDTGKTICDLLNAGYTTYEAALVDAVTDGKGATRHERKLEAYRKIRNTPNAILLKLADRIVNFEHALRAGSKRKYDLYKGEMSGFVAGLCNRSPVTRGFEANVEAMWKYLLWVASDEARAQHWGTLQCCHDHEAA